MRIAVRAFFCSLALAVAVAPAFAQSDFREPLACPARADRAHDGQRDFDFEFGEWRTHLRRLQNPLSGAPASWTEYRGVSIVRPLLGGKANAVELSVEGPAGKIEGVSLRLYSPQAHTWSLHYANMRSGELTPPVVGAFTNGCGEFYAQDTFNGRAIKVRFVILQTSERTARFEQAFSADGGKTWEVNWIATDTRR
jgi:hypothetical protein